MTTRTWTPGNSGDWSDPAQWSPFGVPGSSDTAVIGAAGTYAVTFAAGESFTVGSVDIDNPDATLGLHGTGLNQGASLTDTGAFTNGGTLDVDNVAGGYYAEGGSSLTITGTLANAASADVLIGDIQQVLNAPTTVKLGGLTNAAGASFQAIGFSGTLVTLTTGNFIANAGDFELTYVAPLTLGAAFTNSGTFGLHQHTTLTVDGGFSNSGTLDVDNVAGGYYAEGGSSLTITGTLANAASADVLIGDIQQVLNAPTTVKLGGLTNAAGASLALYGSSSFAATMTVTGPASNSGSLEIGNFATVNVTGSNAFTQAAGTTTVDGTLDATTLDVSGGTLVVDPTGTMTATIIDADGGTFSVDTSTFKNKTTLKPRTAGASISALAASPICRARH